MEKLQLSLPKLITEQDVQQALPKRPINGHKGTFGHGIVIGGSRPYVGAPIYSAKAAFHSGIGLVSLAIPETIYEMVATQNPEALFVPLEAENGHIAPTAFANIDWSLFKAIAIGPGMSRFECGVQLVKTLLLSASVQPVVIDADALYYLRHSKELVQQYKGVIIMTPHPGEMATLINRTVQEVEENRLQVAECFAKEWGVYVLLKGHRSVIATPKGQIWINPIGNDALGKGGSGDVLTGMLLSFLAQGATPEQAMVAASFLHARAGEQQGKVYSHYGATPSDVIEGVRQLLAQWLF